MCTAATYTGKDHYFGRNLDLELSYNESVTVTPRKFPLKFHQVHDMNEHFAIIGMATVVADYPLYYDATNEKGLSMAGLNFPGNADYKEPAEDVDNVASFEFIPWILGQCETVADVRKLLAKINITNVEFSEQFPPSPLHWMISDKNESITVEQTKAGLNVYDNPVGIMTNNPEFPFQMFTLNNYRRVSPKHPTRVSLKQRSRSSTRRRWLMKTRASVNSSTFSVPLNNRRDAATLATANLNSRFILHAATSIAESTTIRLMTTAKSRQ